jgi:hypothetical protein
LLAVVLVAAGASFSAFADMRVALHEPRVDVETAYSQFSQSTTIQLRKEAFRTLSDEMRTDLWLLHLERFLKAHPDLTAEQRDVVLDVIGVLATAPSWQELNSSGSYVAARLHRIDLVALSVMPRDLYSSAFVRLGDDFVLLADEPHPTSGSRSWKVIGNPIVQWDCDCNKAHSFCDTLTNPTPVCATALCKSYPDGCGWFWAQPCDGLCSQGPP